VPDFEDEFSIRLLKDLKEAEESKADCVILCVAHLCFQKLELNNLRRMLNPYPVLIDVPGVFDAEEARRAGFYYQTI